MIPIPRLLSDPQSTERFITGIRLLARERSGESIAFSSNVRVQRRIKSRPPKMRIKERPRETEPTQSSCQRDKITETSHLSYRPLFYRAPSQSSTSSCCQHCPTDLIKVAHFNVEPKEIGLNVAQYRQSTMCTSKLIKYTCGCQKEMEFVQCAQRQGTNVKCDPITPQLEKNSTHYCPKHLVEEAPLKYTEQNGNEV
ncbi:hypothetical protein IWZ01DRAFT_246825 [Phyllosticta capitalensis]